MPIIDRLLPFKCSLIKRANKCPLQGHHQPEVQGLSSPVEAIAFLSARQMASFRSTEVPLRVLVERWGNHIRGRDKYTVGLPICEWRRKEVKRAMVSPSRSSFSTSSITCTLTQPRLQNIRNDPRPRLALPSGDKGNFCCLALRSLGQNTERKEGREGNRDEGGLSWEMED